MAEVEVVVNLGFLFRIIIGFILLHGHFQLVKNRHLRVEVAHIANVVDVLAYVKFSHLSVAVEPDSKFGDVVSKILVFNEELLEVNFHLGVVGG